MTLSVYNLKMSRSRFGLCLVVFCSICLHLCSCFAVRGFAHAAENEVSGQYLDPTKVYQYSYEAEVELNEADVPTDAKAHARHSDVGKFDNGLTLVCEIA